MSYHLTVNKETPHYKLMVLLEQELLEGSRREKINELGTRYASKNQNVESRMCTARYLSKITKFRVASPIVVLRVIKRCLENFTGYNIDVACSLLENCGRYLYRTKHTHKKISELMDTMVRIKKARVSPVLKLQMV